MSPNCAATPCADRTHAVLNRRHLRRPWLYGGRVGEIDADEYKRWNFVHEAAGIAPEKSEAPLNQCNQNVFMEPSPSMPHELAATPGELQMRSLRIEPD